MKTIRKRMLSVCLVIGMILSSFVGMRTHTMTALAATCDVDEGGITIRYAYDLVDDKAANVYISDVKDGGADANLPVSITLPADLDGHPIVSIGDPNVTGADSFLKGMGDGRIPAGDKTIDASATQIETVNPYALYKQAYFTVKLPKTVATIGTQSFCDSEYMHLYCDAINTTCSNATSFRGTYHGMNPSTASSAFSGHFSESGYSTSVGSVAFSITKDTSDAQAPVSMKTGVLYDQGFLYKLNADSWELVKLKEVPTRRHYLLEGIYNGDAMIFDSNGVCVMAENLISDSALTLTAKWNPENEIIHFDGGLSATGQMADITTKYKKETVLPECTLSRKGYDFIGWSETENATTPTYADKAKITVTQNTTLYAVWQEKTYTLKFDANAPAGMTATGSMSDQTFKYTQGATDLPECGYKVDGYTFMGWAGSKNGSVLENKVRATIDFADESNKITLYAIWSLGQYTIEYVNGDDVQSVTQLANTDVTFPTRSKTGYDFLGWSESLTGDVTYPVTTTTKYKNLTTIGSRIRLYARFHAHSYTIRYEKLDGDEGTMTDDICSYGMAANIKKNSFTRSGCRFVGWSTTRQAVLKSSETAKIPTVTTYRLEDLPAEVFNLCETEGGVYTLYPVWQLETYFITYQTGMPASADIKVSSPYVTTYSMGDKVPLPTLTLSGHTFLGWVDENGNRVTEVTPDRLGNLVFTATWDDDFTVRVVGSNIRGITCSAGTVYDGGKITGLFFKKGDVFKNIRIAATDGYLITSYTIKEDKNSVTVLYGSLTTPAATAEVVGEYTFKASSLVIEVTVQPATYNINYNTGGGTINGTYPTTYTYGKGAVLPTDVTKGDLPFFGWRDSSGNTITHIPATQTGDVTVTAVWEDPDKASLPAGTMMNVSMNGVYLTITYPNGTSVDVNLALQNILLKEGLNPIVFTMTDGKRYSASVVYHVTVEKPNTITVKKESGGTSFTVIYADKTTESIAISKYNSLETASGQRVYFQAKDGYIYYALLGEEKPSDPDDGGDDEDPDPEEPGVVEYIQAGNISYRRKGSVVFASAPIKTKGVKTLTVRATVKYAKKTYKVTKVEASAFYGMKSLIKITIGKNVTSIGKNAVRNCTKCKTIRILSGKCKTFGKNCFKNIKKKATIRIKASKSNYKTIVSNIKKTSGCPKSTRFKREK